MSKISKKHKEEVLDKYGINIDSSDRLAKKIVNRYTTVDKNGYLNICWGGKCRRTAVWVDKDFLMDELNYNWKKLTHQGLYEHFLDVMVDELGFDIDFSTTVFVNFILPEIYDVYFKPLEPDYINESFRNHIDNEEKQKKYLDHIYNDLIKNTNWRDASFIDIDLYDGKCKSLQIPINWSTYPPSYSYIPVCLKNYLTDTWGLTYEEINELIWGRYDKHIINMKSMRYKPYNLMESIDRNKKYKLTKEETEHLISLYEDMGYDRESAIDELKDLVSYFNGLNGNLKLYRIICADSEEDINLEYLGSHYSNNKRSLLDNHYSRGSVYGHCEGDKTFLVSVECDKRQMDIMETLSNNILYPNEQEITLLNKGYGCKLLNIEEL